MAINATNEKSRTKLVEIVNGLNRKIVERWKTLGMGLRYKEAEENYEKYKMFNTKTHRGSVAPADRPKNCFVYGDWVRDWGSNVEGGYDDYSRAEFKVQWYYADLLCDVLGNTHWNLLESGIRLNPSFEGLCETDRGLGGYVEESAVKRLTAQEQELRIRELKKISGLTPVGDIHLFVYHLNVAYQRDEKLVG